MKAPNFSITLLAALVLSIGSLNAQCPDARAKKFQAMEGNVQACSQCATLALYFCSAKYATKPEDVQKLQKIISHIKSNIRFMAPNNCCPEMLGESPKFGSMASGKSGAAAAPGSEGSLIEAPQWVKDIKAEDVEELGQATLTAIELGAMALDLINEIFPDVSSAYRSTAEKFNYKWESHQGNGNGTGTIQFADRDYIFQGSIQMGYPEKGKLRLDQYGIFTGSFNDRINAVTAREADLVGGQPTLGTFDYNFGVKNVFDFGPGGEGEFYFQFKNGDKLAIEGKGLRKYAVYYDQQNNEIYELKLKYLKRLDVDEIEDEFPIDNSVVRSNLARYYMATAVRILTYPKMMGRDIQHEWWQNLLRPFLTGAEYFASRDDTEISFWLKEIKADAGA